jgi:transcriptional regulator with XRE-family HTH domain
VHTTLGDRIRGKRAEQRLTQAELARRAGLNPKTIGFIEGGKSGGMYDSISRIASALGVSFEYLETGR